MILVVGHKGFVGTHLINFLRRRYETFIVIDKNYKGSIKKLLKTFKPDKIFHLAARLSDSWKDPKGTILNNIVPEINLFEAIRELELDPIVLIPGSSDEYGISKCPIKETAPLKPISPYGVSKLTQEALAYQYWKAYGIKVVLTRAFIHEGPGRSPQFAISNFAKQIADIEKGKETTLYVGNLDAVRDFTDVRDIVKAYWLATEKCKYGEPYNVCSGKGTSVRDALDILMSFSKAKIGIVQKVDRLRPSDISESIGDCTKFKKATGWEPKIPLKKTLYDTLQYWRNN